MSAPAAALSPAATRQVRLHLAPTLGAGQLDGGWWPRTPDVAAELAALLDAVPESFGRVSRVSLCMPDWPEPHPMRSVQRGLPVKLGWFARMDPHTITLGSSGFGAARLVLLVVPPGLPAEQAERALDSAATTTWVSAGEILSDGARVGRGQVPQPRPATAAAAVTR